MKICGLKLTHDGAIAVLNDSVLEFSIEMEKVENNPRYTAINDTAVIEDILNQNGYALSDIDHFAIDGWGGTDQDALALQPRLEIGRSHNSLLAENNGLPYQLGIAAYTEKTLKHDILEDWPFYGLKIGAQTFEYSSFLHVTGHVMSAYMCSPFAARGESAYVLVWDGGMYPRLYYFDAVAGLVRNVGPLFLLIGNIYTIFSQHFGPFKVKGSFAKDNLSVAGKVMAYIALGRVRPELFGIFSEIIATCYDKPMGFANIFATEFLKRIGRDQYPDEDVLCSFHTYLGQMLADKIRQKIERFDFGNRNLCMAGGCALNIKWNSVVREAGFIKEVFVPPFPNDSGSAIGAACTRLFQQTGATSIGWSVYSGPAVSPSAVFPGWVQRECTIGNLALLLHTTQEPVVLLNGRAELGPRALGNRSIVASPVRAGMKDSLNFIKRREAYRPVSPICLEEYAPDIFTPGTRDPFMLFDHMVKPEWVDRIPAVMHLDGSARLQTVGAGDNPMIHALLIAYEQISGIPLLCNTSANFNGSGFFPDVWSAMKWGEVNYVWNDGVLFEKTEKLSFSRFHTKEVMEA